MGCCGEGRGARKVDEVGGGAKRASSIRDQGLPHRGANGVSENNNVVDVGANGISETNNAVDVGASGVIENNSGVVGANGAQSSQDQGSPEKEFEIRCRKISAEGQKNEAFKQLQTLRLIQQDPLYGFALKIWEDQEAFYYSRASVNEIRRQDLYSQLYNIIGWFAVFQGVVLTAVTQLSPATTPSTDKTPLCGKVWLPATLAGFASFITIIGVLHKFGSIDKWESNTEAEQATRNAITGWVNKLRNLGPEKFIFEEHAKPPPPRDSESTYSRNIYRFCVILSMLILTGLFILSYFVILCDTWMV